MDEERKEHLKELSETVRNLRRTLQRLVRHGTPSPETTRQRLELGNLIEDLIASVTSQERKDFDIW